MTTVDFLQDFRHECVAYAHEALDQLNGLGDHDPAATEALLHKLHAIKGGASFLDLMTINLIAHRAELLAEELLANRRRPSNELTTLLHDIIQSIAAFIESPDFGEGSDTDPLLTRIDRYITDHPIEPITSNFDQQVQNDEQPFHEPVDTEQPFGTFLATSDKVAYETIIDALATQERRQIHPLQALRSNGVTCQDCLRIANLAQHSDHDIITIARMLGIIDEAATDGCRHLIQASRPPLGQILIEAGIADAKQVRRWLQEHIYLRAGVEPVSELFRADTEQTARPSITLAPPPAAPAPSAAAPTPVDTTPVRPAPPAEPAAPTAGYRHQTTAAVRHGTTQQVRNLLPEPGEITSDEHIMEEFEQTFDHEAQSGFEQGLLLIESIPQAATPPLDAINNLQRDLHSLKGCAGFCGAVTLQCIIHTMEDLVGDVKRSASTIDAPICNRATSALLTCLDLAWVLRCQILNDHGEEDFQREHRAALITSLTELHLCREAIAACQDDQNIEDLF